MSERFAQEIWLRYRGIPRQAKILLAGGKMLEVDSVFMCPIKLRSLTSLLRFVVIPRAAENIILGFNFLQAIRWADRNSSCEPDIFPEDKSCHITELTQTESPNRTEKLR